MFAISLSRKPNRSEKSDKNPKEITRLRTASVKLLLLWIRAGANTGSAQA